VRGTHQDSAGDELHHLYRGKSHIGKGTLVVLTIKDGDTKEVLQRCIDVMGFLERS